MKMTTMILAAMMTLAAEGLPKRVTAKVPFPFEARGVAMPAGAYELVPGSHQATYQLREVATGRTIALLSQSRTDNRTGKAWLQFKKYGDKHFLRALAGGGTFAVQVGASRREREMAKATAAETVVTKAE